MIVTKLDDHLRLNLSDYGIKIPLLYDRVQSIVSDLKLKPLILNANPISKEDLLLAHTKEYVEALFSDCDKKIAEAYELFNKDGTPNRYDKNSACLPLDDLFKKSLCEVAGTVESARLALKNGAVHFLGGGMHHAMSFKGGGFCLVNDIVIAIRKLQQEGLIKRAAVIDVDAHKGDGTAEITVNDSTIRTLSIHMARGWPHGDDLSTIDIGIDVKEERSYLTKLQSGIERLLEIETDFVIVVAGSDPYELDELPSTALIKLSLSELLQRDKLIYQSLKKRGIPQLWLLAGGYGKEVYKVTSNFLKFVS